MPSYTYVGEDDRYYPDLGVMATTGCTATFDAKPDDLWVTSASKKAAAVVKPAVSDDPADQATPKK